MVQFFHLFYVRPNLFCSFSFDNSGFQHSHYRVLMKSDTESHPPACLVLLGCFGFFSQYWKLFPAACTKIDWAGKQMNNDFFQVLHNVMNRPPVYYYLLSIFVYVPFPSLKLAFLGFLKPYVLCEITALFQVVQ